MSNGQRFWYVRTVEVGGEEGGDAGGGSWYFPTFFDIMKVGLAGTEERKSEQTGKEQKGGASDFFRFLTF